MFGFFNKRENSVQNLGTFTAYGMEDVHHFLTKSRIESKIKELEGIPTLGTRIEDFITQEMVAHPSGELYFFRMLLGYFHNDLDLAIFLYEKSKSYKKSNYPQKISLKLIFEDHINLMDRLAKKNPEKREIYLQRKRPIYWLEYDLFYFYTLRNLLFNLDLQKLYMIEIEGVYERKGSRLFSSNFELLFRANRNPKVGNYLILKSDDLLNDVKFDLLNFEKEDLFRFNTFYGSYQIEIQENQAVISKVKSFSNPKIDLVVSANILGLISELAGNYLLNFDQITERFLNDATKPKINMVLAEILKINDLGNEMISKIEEELVAKKEIWGKLEDYRNYNFAG